MNLAHDVRVDSQIMHSNSKTQHHEAVKHSKRKESRDTRHIFFPVLGSEMAFISSCQYTLLAQIACACKWRNPMSMRCSVRKEARCFEPEALSNSKVVGAGDVRTRAREYRFCMPRAILVLYILGHWTERSPCGCRCQILVVVVLLLFIPAESTGVPCPLRTRGGGGRVARNIYAFQVARAAR